MKRKQPDLPLPKTEPTQLPIKLLNEQEMSQVKAAGIVISG